MFCELQMSIKCWCKHDRNLSPNSTKLMLCRCHQRIASLLQYWFPCRWSILHYIQFNHIKNELTRKYFIMDRGADCDWLQHFSLSSWSLWHKDWQFGNNLAQKGKETCHVPWGYLKQQERQKLYHLIILGWEALWSRSEN